MFGLSTLKLGLIGGAVAIALFAAMTVRVYNRGYHDGRASAIAEINQANNRAAQAAERAREDLRRECAADPSGCLSDPWTRDRPN